MPFTPTHILAVVPLGYMQSWPVPFSALMIGSLVPDWPLYTSVIPNYQTTHSFTGIFTACVPLGFALYVFFQAVLKIPLFELLPQPLRQRLKVVMMSPLSFRPQAIVGVIVALAVGALTHIVWDGFTHRGQWGIRILPALDNVVLTIAGLDIRGYKLLQYGSTAFGIPILLLCFMVWFRASRPQPVPPSILPKNVRKFLIMLFTLVPPSVGVLSAAQLLGSPITHYSLKTAVVECVIQTGFIFFLLLGCYSILFYPLTMRRG